MRRYPARVEQLQTEYDSQKMRASGVQFYEYKGDLRQETLKKSTRLQRPMQGLPADIRKDRIIPVMLKKNF